MSGARVNRKKPPKALISERVTFVEFLEIFNAAQGQITPPFHRVIAQWLEDTDGSPTRYLSAARDAAKSWMISCFCAWKLFLDPNETFILISAVQELATRNATFVREIIEHHPLTKHLIPVGETELWRRNSFTVSRDKSNPNPSIQALTLMGDWTGRHSHYLFADDVETVAADTADSRKAVKDRIKQFRAMSPLIGWVGTPHWGKQSLYLPLLGDPEYCKSIQFPAYEEDAEGNRSYLWPERLTFLDPEALELKRRDLGDREFNSQYLLMFEDMNQGGLELEFVHAYSDQINRTSQTQWFSSEERVTAKIGDHAIVDLCAAWDPASGAGDDSVLAIAARSNRDQTFIHHAEKLPRINSEGWKPQTQAIIRALKAREVGKIVVETNTNPSLPAELRQAAQEAGYKLRVIGVHNTLKKIDRVRLALENSISAGRLHVHQTVLDSTWAEQARDFPACMRGKAANDWLDASSMAVLHLRKLPPGVIVEGILNDFNVGRGRTAIRPGSAHGDVMERLRAGRRAV